MSPFSKSKQTIRTQELHQLINCSILKKPGTYHLLLYIKSNAVDEKIQVSYFYKNNAKLKFASWWLFPDICVYIYRERYI